jgi:hypothetical protein
MHIDVHVRTCSPIRLHAPTVTFVDLLFLNVKCKTLVVNFTNCRVKYINYVMLEPDI